MWFDWTFVSTDKDRYSRYGDTTTEDTTSINKETDSAQGSHLTNGTSEYREEETHSSFNDSQDTTYHPDNGTTWIMFYGYKLLYYFKI